jgi:hypothetical protein
VGGFFVLLTIHRIGMKGADRQPGVALGIAGIIGLSILAWHSFSNVVAFDQDALPAISPSDALSSIWTYVCWECYAAFLRPAHGRL